MADTLSKAKRSQVMAAVRSKGNRDTELKLVAILRAAGIVGWRRHPLFPGRPDFIFRSERVVIFVDGCFWHGCPRHCRMPASNSRYWREKIFRNTRRDLSATRALRSAGWRVIRIWEHALRHPTRVSRRIIKELSACRKGCKHAHAIYGRTL
jgi:DNA mismatch endonuclease (patch repair protein)